MSEATGVVTPSEAVEQAQEAVVETAQAVDPTESQARVQGWVSKEEWVDSGRAEGEWRPAKEFIDRGELYKSIHQTKRELKQTQAALDALAGHHRLVYEKAYQDAVNELKLQKRQAIRAGDMEQLEAVEEKMDAMKDQRVKEQQQLQQVARAQQQVGPPPEYQEFVSRNPWYASDKFLRDEADAIGFVFLNNGGDKDNLLSHVERQIKAKFPDKFGAKKAAPNAVAPTDRSAKAPNKDDVQLDDNEREVMRTFVRQGVMTEAQYKAELKKAKGRS